ncbi:hypothetical protein OKC46_13190 [Acinetobacter baumannii]|uniref:hypothetical protein n=1 Tax=Acinetobacter baumannii TaxID=470 RepID=UPI00237F0E56|nr:hypothetical protein [Acinetobacter baumannii]MDE3318465.1 hypothetical protein [Acinetobacter baumannii]MDX2339161.1 hypothetical protein [Acinetobacter baumannii]MDX5548944.1 hypothetical protein [Acinetobacter baumannii]
MPKQPLLSAYRPVIGVTTKSEYCRAQMCPLSYKELTLQHFSTASSVKLTQ